MNTHVRLATAFAFLALSSLAHADCDPTVAKSPTRFPLHSQLRGQEGTVLLEVTVDATGRVASTKMLQSSGYRLLDRAATASVSEQWQFDVTGCERKDLPATDLIAVEYSNNEYGK